MPTVLRFSHDAEKPEPASGNLPLREILHKSDARDRVVLVMVDDDEDDCLLVNDAIRQACVDCTFRCVEDGEQLLDYLDRSHRLMDVESCPFPDLILLDLNMPRMHGRKVLEILKTDPRFRAVPVIILTTSRELEDVKVCYDLGANSYITKQATFDDIISCFRTLLEYWIDVATLPRKKTRIEDPGKPNDLS
jgi:two-component system response regulator